MKTLACTLIMMSFLPFLKGDDPLEKAYDVASKPIPEENKNSILSAYVINDASGVKETSFIFHEPDSPSYGKLVVVKDATVTKLDNVPGKKRFNPKAAFKMAEVKPSLEEILKASDDYASANGISYDRRSSLLRRTGEGQAPSWRVQYFNKNQSQGYAYFSHGSTNVASYSQKMDTSGAPDSAADFFQSVEDTFLGIGGDLEQFFTGKRTVDQ